MPIESAPMSIRLRALGLLFAIVWQTLAMVSPLSIAAKSMEYEHAVLHMHASDHHHHDDGSLHLDVLDNASSHLHPDSSVSTSGVLPGGIVHGLMAPLAGPAADTAAGGPSPCLDGLLRPPRHRA